MPFVEVAGLVGLELAQCRGGFITSCPYKKNYPIAINVFFVVVPIVLNEVRLTKIAAEQAQEPCCSLSLPDVPDGTPCWV